MPNYKTWTLDSMYCYNIKHDCKNCYLHSIIETRCKMKKSVRYLLRHFGEPQDLETLNNLSNRKYHFNKNS